MCIFLFHLEWYIWSCNGFSNENDLPNWRMPPLMFIHSYLSINSLQPDDETAFMTHTEENQIVYVKIWSIKTNQKKNSSKVCIFLADVYEHCLIFLICALCCFYSVHPLVYFELVLDSRRCDMSWMNRQHDWPIYTQFSVICCNCHKCEALHYSDQLWWPRESEQSILRTLYW